MLDDSLNNRIFIETLWFHNKHSVNFLWFIIRIIQYWNLKVEINFRFFTNVLKLMFFIRDWEFRQRINTIDVTFEMIITSEDKFLSEKVVGRSDKRISRI